MLENVDGHIGPRNDFLIFQIAVAIGGAFSGSATSVWVCVRCAGLLVAVAQLSCEYLCSPAPLGVVVAHIR